jgi:hypothetical protein
VPVEFLTDDQAAAYRRFTGEPSRADPVLAHRPAAGPARR